MVTAQNDYLYKYDRSSDDESILAAFYAVFYLFEDFILKQSSKLLQKQNEIY